MISESPRRSGKMISWEFIDVVMIMVKSKVKVENETKDRIFYFIFYI